MRKFRGVVGFANSAETPPGSGIWKDVITERTYGGDIIRGSKSTESTDKVNDDVSVNVSISILADPFAFENYTKIRYVQFEGALWKVAERTPERPRITLRLGGLYSGRTPSPPG